MPLTPADRSAAEDLPSLLVVDKLQEAELLGPLGELVGHRCGRAGPRLTHLYRSVIGD